MQRYICNDYNISMYTYMIIYDYNLHIYYAYSQVSVHYTSQCIMPYIYIRTS